MKAKEIVASWENKFSFIKGSADKPGLRAPQIGALHALMAHIENPKEPAIVVMPTGTGKTETMLSFLVANQCEKVFVVVPSDALRKQTYRKFHSLGLLRKIGIVPSDICMPIVKCVETQLDKDEWVKAVEESNVVITTMALANLMPTEIIKYLAANVSHLFVDEAHHSQAETWNKFINSFSSEKVFLFTATPFRNDGQRIKGKIIFNYPLRKAQEDGYYQKIDFCSVYEFTQEESDQKIAEKAVEILKRDIEAGYDHIMMARCATKQRAEVIFKYYAKYPQYSPIIVYSGMVGAGKALRDIKNKKHRIIVCVNMLGEGYDLPQLKIAAMHDNKQSLAVTLQFIGRFTRTNEDHLGNATFITNIALPPLAEEINELFRQDADWNYLLPKLNDTASNEQESIRDFVSKFNGDLNTQISLENIRPAMSAIVYQASDTTTYFNNWREAVSNINKYDYALSAMSDEFLIVVLGRSSNVIWGDTQIVKDLNWDAIIVYFNAKTRNIYLNSSMNINGERFLEKIFPSGISLYSGECVFRVFHNVNRLSLFSVGARMPHGKDVSFQSYYGRSVEDGVDKMSQGNLLKNNLFGVGFREGSKISIGCSAKGKIWSRERADLLQFKDWCNSIGNLIADESIDTNTVMTNMLESSIVRQFRSSYPLCLDWNPEEYERYSLLVDIDGKKVFFDEMDFLIENVDRHNSKILFSLCHEENKCKIEMAFDESGKLGYQNVSDKKIAFVRGASEMNVSDYFAIDPLTIFYADDTIQYGNRVCIPRSKPSTIDDDSIDAISWDGVDLSKESMKHPIIKESIQYHIFKTIESHYAFVIDDDGSGEVADLVGINEYTDLIDITLFHLKFAKAGKVSNDINNLYQVCGQAQKSARWKHLRGDHMFNRLLGHDQSKTRAGKGSSLLKGSLDQLKRLKEKAYNRKRLVFHVVIVQPGMSKRTATDEMRLLLGVTKKYLFETAHIDCRVICSE